MSEKFHPRNVAAEYAQSDDFPMGCKAIGEEPAEIVEERIAQAQRIIEQDPMIAEILLMAEFQ